MEDFAKTWQSRLNSSNLDADVRTAYRGAITQFLKEWDLAGDSPSPTRVHAAESLRKLRENQNDAEQIRIWREAMDWFFDGSETKPSTNVKGLKMFGKALQQRALPTPKGAIGPKTPPLLNRVAFERAATGQKLRERTRKSYWNWLRRYDLFCRKTQAEIDEPGSVEAFLDHLRDEEKLAPMSRTQALNALKFLYRHVFDKPFEAKVKPARKSERTPVVLTRNELETLFESMEPDLHLMCRVMYGSGLRLSELLELRVRDIDLDEQRIVVPDSRGEPKRSTPLPNVVVAELREHLEGVLGRYEADRHGGAPGAEVSEAIVQRHPNAATAWDWQWVFPSRNWTRDSDNQRRRHHWNAFTFQRSVKRAAEKAGLTKKVTPHVFRHTFATHLLQAGTDPKTVQKLMGHRTLETTLSYLHALRNEQVAVRSPLDF